MRFQGRAGPRGSLLQNYLSEPLSNELIPVPCQRCLRTMIQGWPTGIQRWPTRVNVWPRGLRSRLEVRLLLGGVLSAVARFDSVTWRGTAGSGSTRSPATPRMFQTMTPRTPGCPPNRGGWFARRLSTSFGRRSWPRRSPVKRSVLPSASAGRNVGSRSPVMRALDTRWRPYGSASTQPRRGRLR